MQAQFEATAQQKELASIGRAMMDFSENYGVEFGLGKLKDEGFKMLNDLSSVGNKLTRYGTVFGTTLKSFSAEELELIAKFMKNEVVIASK
jgi:hypothetical protein|tara:strand:+ start:560 stop:832 length:273 start_codon:yes stop_codon:yes gene_type:complete